MLASLALWAVVHSQPVDPLVSGFLNPPASAKPHTWWHWMNGNVTREGITADLEAMREVGIGGAQMFTVDQNIPAGAAPYMSPQWRALTTHAIKEAERLGIELCLHNCAGWSSSGGPWIRPEDAMQVLAWSELKVSGPQKLSQVLPQPEAPQVVAKVPYYWDIAVYAYQTPPATTPPADFLAKTAVVRGDGLKVDLASGPGVPRDQIVELTSRLSADGRLEWEVPPGDWTILRMGHVPTGKDNHPAPPEGDGLEVDKLSKEALDRHWNGMVAKVLADAGPLAGKVLNNALIDSYEVGNQNWTPKFREEFRRRRGYDPLPYLPVVAGVTVQDKPTSERFLWDFRRTIADLYADNYFGHFGDLCHRAGLKFSVEPYGNGGFDNMQSGSRADIPMGEFWIPGWSMESVKLAASVGHVYGKPIVGAESFTADEGSGRWLEEPYGLKAVGDRAFTNGLNRVIFHRYAAQPWLDVKPGMTMGPWGTHFDRTQTWWTEAKEWLRYLSRCQFMLQQGRFVADVAYYYGEDAPVDLPGRTALRPAIPAGYDYDGVDAQAVRSMTVKSGRVVLPSGMSYAVLVLPETSFMTPRMAAKIRDLVAAGATVLGPKPVNSPTLSRFPDCQTELERTATELWGDGRKGVRPFGKGRIAVGVSLTELLRRHGGVLPDFAVAEGANVGYIHRRIGNTEAYFVSNQAYRPARVRATFRVKGRLPELWHADTGRIEAAPAFLETLHGVSLDLNLDPAESVFVVFRKPAPKAHFTSFTATDSAAAKLPQVEIVRAFYGTADGRGEDVTERVRASVRQGQYEVRAANDQFGDPVPNVVKRLVLDYRVGGKERHAEIPENGELALLPMAAAGAPAFDVAAAENGDLVLTAWRSGMFSALRSSGSTATSYIVRITVKPKVVELNRNWQVQFAPNLGAPARAHFDRLVSWPDHQDMGIRYFSGSATYRKAVNLGADVVSPGKAVRLDLGEVKNFATVSVNGRRVATLWKPPFVLDITPFARRGRNEIEVKVTNLWPNRIIGDEQLPPEVVWNGNHMDRWPAWLRPGQARIAADRPKTGRVTFATWKYFDKKSPLLPSGLIGPVRIESAYRTRLPGPRR